MLKFRAFVAKKESGSFFVGADASRSKKEPDPFLAPGPSQLAESSAAAQAQGIPDEAASPRPHPGARAHLRELCPRRPCPARARARGARDRRGGGACHVCVGPKRRRQDLP